LIGNLKTRDIAVIGICAALYAAFGRATDLGLTFLGVAFYPAVVIPAVFAVLFGPWVGGFGAAIGIFIRDMLFHGNAALSLAAGVPPNFIVFFLIGYLAARNIDMKKIISGIVISVAVVIAGVVVPVLVFPTEFTNATGLATSEILIVVALMAASFAVIGAVAFKWRQWANFAVSVVIAQAVGAALLSATVVAVSPLFLSYFGSALTAAYVLPLFVWTFATEVPFVLIIGPPIIKAVYRAYPSLRHRTAQPKQGEAVA
jgi:hypothetical protein